MIRHRRLHRVVFGLAGAYNIVWGICAAVYPQWFFHFARMPEANYPEIFTCLGMVIGLYGLLYWEVARVPEQAWRIAAVGLLGKVLGPTGLAVQIFSGHWPMRTMILCLTNDLIWWIPFAIYLCDVWENRTRAARLK